MILTELFLSVGESPGGNWCCRHAAPSFSVSQTPVITFLDITTKGVPHVLLFIYILHTL